MKKRIMTILGLVFMINLQLKAQDIPEQPTLYSYVLKLFNSGYLPDLSEIDTTKSYKTKTITSEMPNSVSKNFSLYCERVGDELLGENIVCGILEANDNEPELASQKSKLLRLYSVLTTNEEGKEFNSVRHSNGYCVGNLTWREVKLQSGARVLITKSERKGNLDCGRTNSFTYTFLTGGSDSSDNKL